MGEPGEAPGRPGPDPLPGDSWDTDPTPARHRRDEPRVPRRYLVVALILAVTAVVATVVLLFDDQPGGPPAARGPTGTATATATTTPTDPTPTAATSAAATPTADSSTPPAQAPPPPPTTDVAAGGTQPPAGFTSLVYEAEAGAPAVRLRRAEVVSLEGASGGAGVQFTRGSGTIEFESIDVPTRDRYRVTIVYASPRDWRGTVRGYRDTERVWFDRASSCCGSVTVVLRLSPGGELSISPSRRNGPLPTIDRIVIEPA